MSKFKEVSKEIQKELSIINYDNGDLGDIGNHVGVVIAKYFDGSIGYDKESFNRGLNHGISLIDGTHN